MSNGFDRGNDHDMRDGCDYRFRTVEREVADMKKKLYGNGTEGLLQQVTTLKVQQKIILLALLPILINAIISLIDTWVHAANGS
jgi:hypothetical protein